MMKKLCALLMFNAILTGVQSRTALKDAPSTSHLTEVSKKVSSTPQVARDSNRHLIIYLDLFKVEDPYKKPFSEVSAVANKFVTNLYYQEAPCLVDKTILRRFIFICLKETAFGGSEFKEAFLRHQWNIYDIADSSFYFFAPKSYNSDEKIGTESVCIFKDFKNTEKWKKFAGSSIKDLDIFVEAGVSFKPDGMTIPVSKQLSTIFTTNYDLHENAAVKSQLKDSENMLEITYNLVHHFFKPWVIFMAGHGSSNKRIASIPVVDFANVLHFFDQLNTKFMAVHSCFAGGENTKYMLERKDMALNLRYPLAVLSAMDALIMARADFKKNIIKDFFTFFDTQDIKDPKKETISQMLKKISLLGDKDWFMHSGGLAGIPQLLVPRLGWFSAIDVDPSILILHKVAQQKGRAEGGIEVKDKLVVIVQPNIIYSPLKLETKKEKKANWLSNDNFKQLPILLAEEIDGGETYWHYYPVFIPQNATMQAPTNYFFEYIDLVPYVNGRQEMRTGIFHFIRNSLLNTQGRKTKCNFLIKKLRGFNDIGKMLGEQKGVLMLDNVFVQAEETLSGKLDGKIMFELAGKKKFKIFNESALWDFKTPTLEHCKMINNEWEKFEALLKEQTNSDLKKVLEKKVLEQRAK